MLFDIQTLTFLFGFVFFVILLTMSIIDIRTYTLPNILTLPLIPFGLFQGIVLINDWSTYAIGALIGYSVFVGIEYGFKALASKDGLGRGDAKLLAVGGAWCGWLSLPYIVLIASCMGLIFVLFEKYKPNPQKENSLASDNANINPLWVPFGPFLALAIFSIWCTQHF